MAPSSSTVLLQECAIAALCVALAGSLAVEERDAEILVALGVFSVAVALVWALVRLRPGGLQAPAVAQTAASAGAAPGLQSRRVSSAGVLRMAPLQEAATLPSSAQLRQLILGRRSMYPKDFNGKPVDRANIELMLEAANWAPTHKLTQPWRFVVLSGTAKAQFEDLTIELCGKLLEGEKAEATVAKMKKKQGTTWPKISHYIVVWCKRQAVPSTLNPEWEEMCATAAAIQNMSLMASSLGVAGYWSSWQEVAREAPAMKEFLGLPDLQLDRILSVFSLGMCDEERAAAYRGKRGPVDEKVQWRV